MWKQYWNTLKERPQTWTTQGKSNLVGLVIVLLYLCGILFLSTIQPYAAAELSTHTLLWVMIVVMATLAFLAGRLVAHLFVQAPDHPKQRDPVVNLVLFLVFSIVVVANVVYWAQIGMLEVAGPLGDVLTALLTSFSIQMEWFYFADAFIIVAVAAFHLSEEL